MTNKCLAYYVILPTKDNPETRYIGGPAGHSCPVGWKFVERGDSVPPRLIKE